MKKIVLSALALMAFGLAGAQENTAGGPGFSSGDIFISGSVGFQSEKTGDITNDSFTITPMAGVFVTDNIAIGGQVGYTHGTDNTQTGLENYQLESDVFGIGAFARYYFMPASAFSVFGQLSVAYQTADGEFEVNGDIVGVKADGFGADLAPGINYFVSDHFALQATVGSIGYNTVNTKVDGAGDVDTNSFSIGLNLSEITLGLLYRF